MGTFNIPSALLGTSAPVTTVLVNGVAVRLNAKQMASVAKATLRQTVLPIAIERLLAAEVVVAGITMNGIQAIESYLAFQSLVGSTKNYKVPVQFGQAVVTATKQFINDFQAEMGGVEAFPIGNNDLQAVVLEADRIDGVTGWVENYQK